MLSPDAFVLRKNNSKREHISGFLYGWEMEVKFLSSATCILQQREGKDINQGLSTCAVHAENIGKGFGQILLLPLVLKPNVSLNDRQNSLRRSVLPRICLSSSLGYST
jgi:hypothetical protein